MINFIFYFPLFHLFTKDNLFLYILISWSSITTTGHSLFFWKEYIFRTILYRLSSQVTADKKSTLAWKTPPLSWFWWVCREFNFRLTQFTNPVTTKTPLENGVITYYINSKNNVIFTSLIFLIGFFRVLIKLYFLKLSFILNISSCRCVFIIFGNFKHVYSFYKFKKLKLTENPKTTLIF